MFRSFFAFGREPGADLTGIMAGDEIGFRLSGLGFGLVGWFGS